METSRMDAVRLYGPGLAPRLESIPIPVPVPGEALLRVRAAGLCHTELHLLDGVISPGVVPLTPGHEVVADVVGVREPAGAVIGQRVLLYYYSPCGACRWCRSGHEQLCPRASRQYGFNADGGFAGYMTAPSVNLVPLPDHLTDAEAVGLACGGATAYHAVRSVAQVLLGETVVVYGVGGVGLFAIQLCALAGARVIAISRTASKLALAEELGASAVIIAGEQDPLTAVHALTHGDGADVVFDLVASAQTMQLAPRMLQRRGRLIMCGYGADNLTVPPLWLVLRELQVLGSVGNTLAELRNTVELAAAGKLRSVTGATFALYELPQAIEALRRGEIVGRAVIYPHGQQGVTPHTAVSIPQVMAAPKPEPVVQAATAGAGISTAPMTPQQHAQERPTISSTADFVESTTPMPGQFPFERELLDVVSQGVDGPLASDDAAFNRLALGLFAYQFQENRPYRQFCEYRGVTPDTVRHWRELPAVPIGAFKEAVLTTDQALQGATLFASSGTTNADRRSRHYHPSLAVYDANTRANFAAHMLPDGAMLPLLVLNPTAHAAPNSSLAHYLTLMVDAYGATGSDYFVDQGGLQFDRLFSALHAARRRHQPVCLLGTTFAFVHLLDAMHEQQLSLTLPAGSRMMDTGGVKGRSREIQRDDLERVVSELLGIPASWHVNMYGLTELSTQFLDNALRNALRNVPTPRCKTVPAWSRVRVLNPDTLEELPDGQEGVLCLTDLANRASACTILTEDIGVKQTDGFEILGRVNGAQARGCSIAMDELLEATGRNKA